LDQALMAFAGEASAQVVLVAGEGIGDGSTALAWLGGGGLEALGDALLLVLEGLEA
jgi:hypothetical protein